MRGSSSTTAKVRSTWVRARGWQSGHQLRGALGRHDAGHLGHGQHVALGQRLLLAAARRVARRHPDPGADPGDAARRPPCRPRRPCGPRPLSSTWRRAAASAVVVHPQPPTCDMPRAVRPGSTFLSNVLHSSDSAIDGQHRLVGRAPASPACTSISSAGEQAVLQPAVGRQAQAVALAAEVVGHRADEADGALVPGEAVVAGRPPSPGRGDRLQRTRSVGAQLLQRGHHLGPWSATRPRSADRSRPPASTR